MRLTIIGCGLIGAKRAAAAAGHKIVAVCDLDIARRERLARETSARRSRTGARPSLSTPTLSWSRRRMTGLRRSRLAAVEAGRHVLVEKPAGRRPDEVAPIAAAAKQHGRIVKVGFNHRFHPAIAKAKSLVDEGAIGPLLFIRGRYGHGGRIGYEKEWRFQPEISGGGELIDQGSHLIDLSRWFLGDLTLAYGAVPTLFLAGTGGGQLLPRAVRRREAHGMAARVLDRVEEPVRLRNHGPRRQADHRRARRQLWRRTPDAPSHAAADGAAGNHELGVSLSRSLVCR